VTSRIERSGERKPPLAMVWYICATSNGLKSTAPSMAEAYGRTSRSTPSRRTLPSTLSMPRSVPRRAAAALYECASARRSGTMPWNFLS
jgi:hypothetical protein